MTPEQIKKEIETKELLNIPYDSGYYALYSMPTVIKISDLKIDYRNRGFVLLVNSNMYTGHSFIIDVLNDIIPNFIDNFEEKVEGIINFDEHSIMFDESATVELLFKSFFEYIKYRGINPKISLEAKLTSGLNKKLKLYKKTHRDPEIFFKTIFHPTIKTHRLEGPKPRSSYYSPFSTDSFKHNVLMLDKELCLFCIEYLWGKNLNMSVNGSELMQTLASLPNTNFGINDVQLLKKFITVYDKREVKALKSHFESCGIKPASDLKRWRKHLS